MTSRTPKQRVGIYLRVSTLNQETENQLLQLRALCEQQGWRITKEYVDVESGRKGKRERSDFAQLFKDAAHHRFDLEMLCWFISVHSILLATLDF